MFFENADITFSSLYGHHMTYPIGFCSKLRYFAFEYLFSLFFSFSKRVYCFLYNHVAGKFSELHLPNNETFSKIHETIYNKQNTTQRNLSVIHG